VEGLGFGWDGENRYGRTAVTTVAHISSAGRSRRAVTVLGSLGRLHGGWRAPLNGRDRHTGVRDNRRHVEPHASVPLPGGVASGMVRERLGGGRDGEDEGHKCGEKRRVGQTTRSGRTDELHARI
jgi:hypothetical protein